MANFNDLKARYSHVFDRLSEIENLEAVSGTLEGLEANISELEGFVAAELGSVIAVEAVEDVVEEVPVEDTPQTV